MAKKRKTPKEFKPGNKAPIKRNEKPISDYGVIGDLHTVALVGIDASIDFLCFPFFDSPSIFAALLDNDKGGYFDVSPILKEVKPKQFYLPDTNILMSRFLSHEGVAEISDFMVVDEDEDPSHQLVRRAKTVRGEITYRFECRPRFNYGRSPHRVTKVSDNEVLFESEGKDKTRVVLNSQVPLKVDGQDVVMEFTLKENESATFILGEADGDRGSCHARLEAAPDAFKRTLNYWQHWVRKSQYTGRWREMVNRSSLVLKMLTCRLYGSIVAAPTFGLPETIGGERNWDYRFTWIRDASFTLYGLIRLGYTDEARRFMRWIEDRCKEREADGGLQVMYGIDGRHALPEETLDHFEGYLKSTPVRIGNDARHQLQLDIYGELMDSIYLYNKYGSPIHYDLWQDVVALLKWLCENWNQPDEGIWEVRGGRHHFLYSRVMCWVAIDRGIRLADKRSFPAPRELWETTRDEIYYDVMNNFWNEERGAFVQYKGAEVVDASALIMPLVKFISPTDPRFLSTMKVIKDELVEDSLVFRYNDKGAPDGLTGTEGTFCMCTFWFVECLTRSGRVEEARFFFEKMMGYANHLGLYAEELGPSGEHLGNFPQAFTHLSLISAAFNLDRAIDRKEGICAPCGPMG
jgi:GH15 family glucan-1,4-alpha-glucosidase